jgi:competence protein ComEC
MSENDRKVIDYLNRVNENWQPVQTTTDPLIYGGVQFVVFWPSDDCISKADLNTYSCVCVFKYAGRKVVITGDNNKEILSKMINGYKFRTEIANADILLAPHHGRDSDFCKDFFKAVNPQLTVISDKPKMHDSQSNAANNYRGRGIKVEGEDRYTLTTRKDGSISVTIRKDGEIDIKTYKMYMVHKIRARISMIFRSKNEYRNPFL